MPAKYHSHHDADSYRGIGISKLYVAYIIELEIIVSNSKKWIL